MRHVRPHVSAVRPAATAIAAAATMALAGCGSAPAPRALYGDAMDAQVFIVASGHGSQTLGLATVTPAPRVRRLTIALSCTGGGMAAVKVTPGGEGKKVNCVGVNTVGTVVSGPASLPVPLNVSIIAPKGTRWNIAVANPAGADGVALGNP